MENNMEIAVISEQDLSLVENNSLNKKQLQLLLQKTPKAFVRTRPAKGGGTWDYVSGGYVKKVLNLLFGWDWDFIVMEQMILHGEAIVKGKLTCRCNGREIVKMQFGNKEIIYKTEKVFNEDGSPKMVQKYGKTVQETRPSDIPLSIGNDLKAATTDALKKCAAEIGIAADIYNKEEFKEILVASDDDVTEIYNENKSLFESKKEFIPATEFDNIKREIEKDFNVKNVKLYRRINNFLKSL